AGARGSHHALRGCPTRSSGSSSCRRRIVRMMWITTTAMAPHIAPTIRFTTLVAAEGAVPDVPAGPGPPRGSPRGGPRDDAEQERHDPDQREPARAARERSPEALPWRDPRPFAGRVPPCLFPTR